MLSQPIERAMTRDNLVTAPVGTTLDEAERILARHRIEKLPVVDADGVLRGLITVKDIFKRQQHPDANKDQHGRLRVAAAVVSESGKRRIIGLAQEISDAAHCAAGSDAEKTVSAESNIASDKARSEFCHDISGPLTAILVQCDLLLDSNCPPAVRQRIEAIFSEALRIHQRLRTQ